MQVVGTLVAIEEYTKILNDKYNIKLIYQRPRSPETNVLDLGIWCTLQWAVDRIMRGKRGDTEALNRGVLEVWEGSPNMESAFTGVWDRLTRVLKLIQADEGGNETVESMRGKKGAELDTAFEYGVGSTTQAPPAAAAATVPQEAQRLNEIIEILEEEEDDDF